MTHTESANITKPKIMRRSIILGLASIIIAILLAAGGHGTYFPAKILFPWTMISTAFFDEITGFFALVSLAQFPVYGFILTVANRNKMYDKVRAMLIMIHVGAIIFALIFSSRDFSA